jgi:hypothetical protein
VGDTSLTTLFPRRYFSSTYAPAKPFSVVALSTTDSLCFPIYIYRQGVHSTLFPYSKTGHYRSSQRTPKFSWRVTADAHYQNRERSRTQCMHDLFLCRSGSRTCTCISYRLYYVRTFQVQLYYCVQYQLPFSSCE